MTNGIDLPGRLDVSFNDDATRLWSNDDNQFIDVSAQAGITDTASGKGLLTLDYDRDGDLDLFVVNNAGHPVLYRNELGVGHSWLRIRTVGTVSNQDGIGTFISVMPDLDDRDRIFVREIDGGSNFLGQNERIAHFGLGEWNDNIDLVTLHWPSGRTQQIHNVPVNQLLVAVEPVPEPAGLVVLTVGAALLLFNFRPAGGRALATNETTIPVPAQEYASQPRYSGRFVEQLSSTVL